MLLVLGWYCWIITPLLGIALDFFAASNLSRLCCLIIALRTCFDIDLTDGGSSQSLIEDELSESSTLIVSIGSIVSGNNSGHPCFGTGTSGWRECSGRTRHDGKRSCGTRIFGTDDSGFTNFRCVGLITGSGDSDVDDVGGQRPKGGAGLPLEPLPVTDEHH